MKRVPIKVARDLAKKLGMVKAVILLEEDSGRQHVVTWGKQYKDCMDAAYLGNYIKRSVLGWAPELCNSKPRRQILHEKKMLERIVKR